ncbi:MAG TPA: hypothetical protein VMV46_20030 [Thermoanaerobaculia bacterium]|nr:hypothetical protein [Thermoanaerobaculia bacterium]
MAFFVIVGSVAAVVAIAAAWALLLAARRRAAALLAAVELCQRQLTELRSVVDAGRSDLAEVRALLEQSVAPRLERLERARALGQAARELERAVAAGTLEPAATGDLVERLERLEIEVLSGDRGY